MVTKAARKWEENLMRELIRQILNEYRLGALTLDEAIQKIERLLQGERYRL